MIELPTTRTDCVALDAADVLAPLRERFVLPEGVIYLDGNSLGAMPVAAVQRAQTVLQSEWAQGLIRSWNDADWWGLPTRIGDKLAQLLGAHPGEIVMTDSTAINLYKAVAAACQLVPERREILLEGSNFPTDNYIVQGLIDQLGDGYRIRFAEGDALAEAISEHTAVVCLTDVHYKTGRVLDATALTRRAHDVGAVTVWDLCHSAGVLPVDLQAWKADFAVGCSYKYLNGGPGAPAWIYMAKRHQGRASQPLWGWWGHADPFSFERDYQPEQGVRQMLCGTQSILALATAEVGLDIALEADMRSVRRKSMALTQLFIERVSALCGEQGVSLVSPEDPASRGSQVALSHPQGRAVVQALIERGVIGDFRAPDIMRFGFAPLYLRYVDAWDAAQILYDVLADGAHDRVNISGAVT